MNAPAQSPDLEPAWPDDALEVGRVVDAWGVKGWIKVQPFSSEPQALLSTRRWFLKTSDDRVTVPPRREAGPQPASLEIVDARRHGDFVVALPKGVADRGAAEALRGTRVFVPRSSFPVAGDDEYYWVDLIGLEVVNRQGARLGTVTGLLDTGPHSVLRVQPAPASAADAPEVLIPFVAAYVDTVDLPTRRITVDWGLDF